MPGASRLAISAAILSAPTTAPIAVNADTGADPGRTGTSAKVATLDPSDGIRPKGVLAWVGPGPTKAPKDIPCDADEVSVIYEEDETGSPVPGTEMFGRTDP
jgi:hypothetical protein